MGDEALGLEVEQHFGGGFLDGLAVGVDRDSGVSGLLARIARTGQPLQMTGSDPSGTPTTAEQPPLLRR